MIRMINSIFQNELKELEEKFRKAMVANAGLDNEKSALNYQVRNYKNNNLVEPNYSFLNMSVAKYPSILFYLQVELLKDQMEEVEEQASLVTKELREKNRDYELLKRSHAETQRAVQLLQVIL